MSAKSATSCLQNPDAMPGMVLPSPIGIPTVGNVEDTHGPSLIIDSNDHPIRPSPGTVSVIEGRTKARSDAMWIVEERPDDELMCRDVNGLREFLRQLMAGGRGNNECISFRLSRHESSEPRRCFIAAAKSASDSPSPSASSASEVAMRRMVSGSERMASVSSSDSRSSGARRTADGVPRTVTVTRSC